jgi:hypothetical protein
MPSSRAERPGGSAWEIDELQKLSALGFGPDSALMREPKLLVDLPFLAALQRELASELGDEDALRALFHIGAIHGLRDAMRIGSASPGRPDVVEFPPLSMRFGSHRTRAGALEMAGTWPDHFEAEARLSKLGASQHPTCALSAGYTSGWLSGSLARDVVAVERTCRAAGADHCTFVARDEGSHADEVDSLPRRLPIASLRAVAGEVRDAGDAHGGQPALVDALPDHLDPADPAVHIWGPVMVMPFTGPETSLPTIEMLTQDEATRGVRVVVLDLCGEVLDPGFGAAAVESLVERVQSWGAEVVLTGISPFSEEAVAELQANLLVSRKELPEAIAYAFQIAEAQRHLL